MPYLFFRRAGLLVPDTIRFSLEEDEGFRVKNVRLYMSDMTMGGRLPLFGISDYLSNEQHDTLRYFNNKYNLSTQLIPLLDKELRKASSANLSIKLWNIHIREQSPGRIDIPMLDLAYSNVPTKGADVTYNNTLVLYDYLQKLEWIIEKL